MTYLILANLSLILFFGIYLLVLKRLTFFQWNRIYLLSVIVVSFTTPLLQFVDLSQHKDVYLPLAINLGETTVITTEDTMVGREEWSVMDWLWMVYAIGVGLMLFWFVLRLYRILTLFGRGVWKQRSFSFFKFVSLTKANNQSDVIEKHERVHIQQGHSYDLLFLEMLWIFNWFNPVYYFYLKELKFQHECIADEISAGDKVQYAELLVAHAMNAPHHTLIHEFSNQSFLKRRIMMLFKNKSKKINRVKYILILPIMLLVSGIAIAFNSSIKEVMGAGVDQWEQTAPITNEQDTVIQKPDEVFMAVEVSPTPKDGLDAFREWVGRNVRLPQEAVEAGVKGQLLVSFIVEKDGTLSEFKRINDIGHGLGEAVIETLKKAEPWNPGTQNGKNVRVSYTVPLAFNLDSAGGEQQ